MALINQGGKLLVQNGKLASGQGCCCGGGGGGGTCCECPGGFLLYWSVDGAPADSLATGFYGTYFPPVVMTTLAPLVDSEEQIGLDVNWFVLCDPQTGLYVVELRPPNTPFTFTAWYSMPTGTACQDGLMTLSISDPPENAPGEHGYQQVRNGNYFPYSTMWVDFSRVTIQIRCAGCCCGAEGPDSSRGYLECIASGGTWSAPFLGNAWLVDCYKTWMDGDLEIEYRCENPLP